MKRTARSLFVAAGAVALVVLLFMGWRVTRGRNGLGVRAIVLVTIDTVRTDRIGCYGGAGGNGGLTPTLDRLAREGVRVERCLTTAPITLPAHASILSGTDPIAHGVRINGAFAFAPDNPSLAAVLREQGFRTAAFVSAAVLDRRFGLDHGFEEYDGPGAAERVGEQTVDAALGFVERAGNAPFFLWVHLFDPHAPYAAPAPFGARYDDPYDGELAYTDACVERLLDGIARLGRLADALVCVTGDHGEGLGDHDEQTHTTLVYDTTLRVPWLLWSPGRLPAGLAVEQPASVIAIAPTMLDLLALERPPGMYGPSLASAVLGGSAAADPAPLRFETLAPEYYYGFAPLVGLEHGGSKLIVAPRPELYDVAADPAELDNLYAERRAVADDLKRRLDAYEREHATDRGAEFVPDDDIGRRLEMLGYVGGRAHRVPGDGRDPKDTTHIVNAIQEAGIQSAADPAQAIDTLERLLEKEPGVAEAWELLGDVRSSVPGRSGEARTAYREALALRRGEDPVLHTKIGETALRLGEARAAEESFALALGLDDNFVAARVQLANLQLRRGSFEEARQNYDRILQADPRHFGALKGRGHCLFAQGNWRLAEQDLREARRVGPADFDVLHCLGRLYDADKLADRDKAIVCYEEALALQPDGMFSAEIRERIAFLSQL
jgi:arylsulfatase A-like enzyme/Tfp pilus assembly protein PilF